MRWHVRATTTVVSGEIFQFGSSKADKSDSGIGFFKQPMKSVKIALKGVRLDGSET